MAHDCADESAVRAHQRKRRHRGAGRDHAAGHRVTAEHRLRADRRSAAERRPVRAGLAVGGVRAPGVVPAPGRGTGRGGGRAGGFGAGRSGPGGQRAVRGHGRRPGDRRRSAVRGLRGVPARLPRGLPVQADPDRLRRRPGHRHPAQPDRQDHGHQGRQRRGVLRPAGPPDHQDRDRALVVAGAGLAAVAVLVPARRPLAGDPVGLDRPGARHRRLVGTAPARPRASRCSVRCRRGPPVLAFRT